MVAGDAIHVIAGVVAIHLLIAERKSYFKDAKHPQKGGRRRREGRRWMSGQLAKKGDGPSVSSPICKDDAQGDTEKWIFT